MTTTKDTTRALTVARRALTHLEERTAGLGARHIPMDLQIELEEKRREVAALEARLSEKDAGTYNIHIEHAEGLAIGDGAQVVRPEAPAPGAGAPPGVGVTLLTRIVPTAFCHQLGAEEFPLVSVTLDNTGEGCAGASLRVTTTIEDYSDVAVTTVDISQGRLLRVSLLPSLKPTVVAMLNEIRPVTLRVSVEQMTPTPRVLYDQTERIHLHARDVALLAVEAPDGSIIDLTRYLVAWVTPRRPEIEQLLRRAATHYPERRFVGYQGASTATRGAEIVRAQAQAIFTALKEDADLAYINSPLNLGGEEGQITQRVRFPRSSLEAGGSANCRRDGALRQPVGVGRYRSLYHRGARACLPGVAYLARGGSLRVPGDHDDRQRRLYRGTASRSGPV